MQLCITGQGQAEFFSYAPCLKNIREFYDESLGYWLVADLPIKDVEIELTSVFYKAMLPPGFARRVWEHEA